MCIIMNSLCRSCVITTFVFVMHSSFFFLFFSLRPVCRAFAFLSSQSYHLCVCKYGVFTEKKSSSDECSTFLHHPDACDSPPSLRAASSRLKLQQLHPIKPFKGSVWLNYSQCQQVWRQQTNWLEMVTDLHFYSSFLTF